jgi:16S rRNA (guanine527-N7)-methyltransferase
MKLIKKGGSNSLENGFLYLKGGEFEEELKSLRAKWKVYPLSEYFTEEFFGTKKVVHLYRFTK